MLKNCTICDGHHDLEDSDLCPVCEAAIRNENSNS